MLRFEGSRNLRDLGGYRTADGRQVRWGQLFRSGMLSRLTAAGVADLRACGLRALCDLRTSAERESEPFPIGEFAGLKYWSRDYLTSFAELRETMRSGFATGEAAREGMIAGYRELPFEQAPAYRQVFAHLKAGEVPVLFNCTAGKDRAGTAAALVLRALGVPREIVIEDYALTNEVLNLRHVLSRQGGSLAAQPPEVGAAVARADPAYLTAALDSIDARHGGIGGFLREVLDVSDREQAEIRDALLE